MANRIYEFRPKGADNEKITINLGHVDLGHIDLLVQEGFYSNRTEFIRTAIRNQLERHTDAVKQTLARKKSGARATAFQPRRSGGSACRRADAPYSCVGAGEHCKRCHSRTRLRDDRIDRGAGRATRQFGC